MNFNVSCIFFAFNLFTLNPCAFSIGGGDRYPIDFVPGNGGGLNVSSLLSHRKVLQGKVEEAKMQTEERIVQGIPVNISVMPWYVALIKMGDLHCSGNLVSTTRVLTAAHCVTKPYKFQGEKKYFILNSNMFKIRLGSTYPYSGGQANYVTDIKVHPDYRLKEDVIEYKDLAVLILWFKVEYSSSIQPATFWNKMEVSDLDKLAGMKCTVAGWGAMSFRGPKPGHLLFTEVTLVKSVTCKAYYGIQTDPEVHVCALDSGRDPCMGDSGGGLYCDGAMIGAVSWGYGCAVGNPGVYSRVDNEFDFISSRSRQCSSICGAVWMYAVLLAVVSKCFVQ